jgi:hypothetical protein
MAITSQVRSPLGYGEAMVDDWRGAGLIKASVCERRLKSAARGEPGGAVPTPPVFGIYSPHDQARAFLRPSPFPPALAGRPV